VIKEQIEGREKKFQQMEEDFNVEIQHLLETIDEHKKQNDKLNKHYKKRFGELRDDINMLY